MQHRKAFTLSASNLFATLGKTFKKSVAEQRFSSTFCWQLSFSLSIMNRSSGQRKQPWRTQGKDSQGCTGACTHPKSGSLLLSQIPSSPFALLRSFAVIANHAVSWFKHACSPSLPWNSVIRKRNATAAVVLAAIGYLPECCWPSGPMDVIIPIPSQQTPLSGKPTA